MPSYKLKLKLNFEECGHTHHERVLTSDILDFPNTIHAPTIDDKRVESLEFFGNSFIVSRIEHILDKNYSLVVLNEKILISTSEKGYTNKIDDIIRKYQSELDNLSKKK